MKAIVKCVLAVALVLATALPAMAGSWDVCIDPTTDINLPFEFTSSTPAPANAVQLFFSAVAFFYPPGTFTSSSLSTCKTDVTKLGRFFAKGAVVNNLPDDNAVHDFFADWYFQFDAGGSFSTTGPVPHASKLPAGTMYRQTITGSFGGRAAATGKAVITVISTATLDGATVDAFNISVP